MPMNIDEAGPRRRPQKVNYVAFRDADSGGISVVILRRMVHSTWFAHNGRAASEVWRP